MCIQTEAHIDISRQVSNESNAALEGELSTRTIRRPREEGKKKAKNGNMGGGFGISMGIV